MNIDTCKISIAMTSYNGEKYIIKQLESIVNQSRIPDEVIICDDISKDNTVSLVEEFIKDKNLTNWKIVVNETNLGWQKNFYKALSLTTGDIIFFSDQDDIWHSDKIEKMANIILSKNAGCVYGQKSIIDSDGQPLTSRNEKKSYSGKIKQIACKRSFFNTIVLGCTMCINRLVADKYLEIGYPQGGHDSQCARIALLYHSLYIYDSPVIDYRIHSTNSSGISSERSYGASNLVKRRNDIERIIEWLKIVAEKNDFTKISKRKILKAIAFETKRLDYLSDKSKRMIISLLPYLKYYTGLTMLLGDYAYKHQINNSMGKMRWKLRRK